jgi:hypothetical protein
LSQNILFDYYVYRPETLGVEGCMDAAAVNFGFNIELCGRLSWDSSLPMMRPAILTASIIHHQAAHFPKFHIAANILSWRFVNEGSEGMSNAVSERPLTPTPSHKAA